LEKLTQKLFAKPFSNDAPAEHTNKQDQQNGDEGAVKKVVAVQQEVVKKQ
jgi:hypothetical protein